MTDNTIFALVYATIAIIVFVILIFVARKDPNETADFVILGTIVWPIFLIFAIQKGINLLINWRKDEDKDS